MPRWSDTAGRVPTAVIAAASVFVAVEAFRLAYAGSRGAALDMGVPASSAGAYPWCIEGVIVVASTATLALPRGDRRLAWLVMLGFTGISMAANVLHALDATGHRVWSPYFALVPPLALPLCVRLAERVAMATVHRPLTAGDRAALPAAGPDVAGPAVPPGRAGGTHLDATTGSPSTPPPAGSLPAAVDGGPVDAPSNVHRTAPAAVPDRPVDSSLDDRVDTGLDGRVDVDQTVHRSPRRGAGGHRTGRTSGRRTGRPAGHSADRQTPDWRTVDWYAVSLTQDVKRARAYEIIKADPGAVDAAREQLRAMNGSAP